MTTKSEPPARSSRRATWWATAAVLTVAAVLLASQWLLARHAALWTHASMRTVADVLPLVALLGFPGLLALIAIPTWLRQTPSTATLAAMLGVGLLMRFVWYGAPAPLEDDFYRYLWDGAVVVAGGNPYALSPAEVIAAKVLPPALVPLAEAAKGVLAHINFPEMTSIYPGAAQLAFALAHHLSPLSLDGLRFVFLLAEVAALVALWALLRDLGRPPLAAALYWLNPLVVWSSHATVHSDALLPAFLLGACLFAWRGRHVLSAVLLAGAVGVKIWPVLLAPLLGRRMWAAGRVPVVPALVFGGLTGLLLLPLGLSALAGMRSGLVAYSDDWWNNNAAYAWVSYGVYHVFGESRLALRLLRLATAIAIGLLALQVARHPPKALREMLGSAAIVSAALFYLSPTEFPWYALWFIGFAAALECRPLLLASATLAVYYVVFPLSLQGKLFVHLYYVAALHALPVWLWLALEWRRQRTL